MHHRVYVGNVISTKMTKTVVVAVPWVQNHRRYGKMIRRVKKLYVHDPYSQCQPGDQVSVEEVRPLSRTKRWLVKQILKKGDVTQMPRLEESTQAISGGVTIDLEVPSVGLVDEPILSEAPEAAPAEAEAAPAAPAEGKVNPEGGRG